MKLISYIRGIGPRGLLVLILSAGMFVATAGYNIYTDGSKYHTAFYLLFLLPGIIYLATDRGVFKAIYHDRITWLVALFLLTVSLSLFYPGTLSDPEEVLVQVLLIILSLFVIAQFVALNPDLFEKILMLGVLIVAVVAVYHVHRYYFVEQHAFRVRLRGYFFPRNPLHFAGSFGFSFVIALYLLFKHWRQPLMAALLAMSGGAILTAVIATQSRSFIVSVFAAVLIPWAGKGFRVVMALMALMAIVFLAVIYIHPTLLERTALVRPQIWQQVLELIGDKPFTGWGSEYDPEIEIRGKTLIDTHNVFLAIWLKYGVLSVITLVFFYCYAFVVVLRNRGNDLLRFGGALVVFGVTMLFFEGHDIIAKPNRLWFMVWVPLGIMIGARHVSFSGRHVIKDIR